MYKIDKKYGNLNRKIYIDLNLEHLLASNFTESLLLRCSNACNFTFVKFFYSITLAISQLLTSPVRLKTKWLFLSDYSFYVRSFLTRAVLHAARSTKALY